MLNNLQKFFGSPVQAWGRLFFQKRIAFLLVWRKAWMPAFAGMTVVGAWLPLRRGMPAFAGMTVMAVFRKSWMPAFAGMTVV